MRMLQRVDAVLSNLDAGGQVGAVQSTRAITLAEVASVRKLRRAEPDRVDWSHELSLSLKHIAHAYELTGDIEDARAHYRESLEINQVLVEKQPGKEDLKADRREIEAALANLGGMRPNCPLQPQP